jgi:hemolysin activation/secretion protein
VLKFFKNKASVFLVCAFMWSAFFTAPVKAQTQVPPSGESGLSEKALRQSQPKPLEGLEARTPEIIVIEDSRKLEDPGAGPAFFVKGFEIEGNTVIDDKTLALLLDIGDGLEATLGILALTAQEITALYASKGYFLAKAYIPRQKIENGRVKILIDEGKIGGITIKDNKRFTEDELLKRLEIIKKEDVLSEKTLEEILLSINDLPGIKVRSLLKAGKEPGTSDLTLEVTESSTHAFSFDVDNFGSRFTGKTRMGISLSTAHLLTFGDLFAVRGVKSEADQNLVQTSYQFPLNDSGTRTLRFTFTHSDQNLGGGLEALNAGGRTHIFNIEGQDAFLRTKTSQMKFKAGFNFKRFKNFQLNQTTSNDNINDVYLGVNGYAADSYLGRSTFDLTLARGIAGTDQDSALPSRVDGNAEVSVLNLSLSRIQGTKLLNSYFILKSSGQLTSNRALSPNLFAVGGFGTVRGFPLSEQSGDWGYNLAAEYIIPFPSKMPFGVGKLTLNQIFSFTAFLEHGKVFVRDARAGENVRESITGGGFGFQVNIPKDKGRAGTNFSISYGLPLTGPAPSDASSGIIYANGLIKFY